MRRKYKEQRWELILFLLYGIEHLVQESHLDYLKPLQEKQVDTLVLGCTHYPLLTGVISYVMGNDVTLVSSAEETAKDLYWILVEKNLLNNSGNPTYKFVSTGDTESFSKLARRFLGPEVVSVEKEINWVELMADQQGNYVRLNSPGIGWVTLKDQS